MRVTMGWLIDILVLLGLVAIGYVIFQSWGLTALIGYIGGICLMVAALLVLRRDGETNDGRN